MTQQLNATAEFDAKPDWHPCPPDPECPHCADPHAPPHLDWSCLDAVYCISLKSREDRVAWVSGEFHRTGLCRYVQFYRPEKHPVKGIVGSWESHRQVAMHALEAGHRNALVLEDDVQFFGDLTPKRLARVGDTLRGLPSDWHILYLGHWPVEAWFARPGLLNTRSACAHAYVISPRLMAWLRDHPYGTPGIAMSSIIGKALDSAFSRLPGTYALVPMLATQRASVSDNYSFKPKAKTKLKHWVTRSRYRELLLSKLMRPAELLILLLSPIFWLRNRWRSWRAAPVGQ